MINTLIKPIFLMLFFLSALSGNAFAGHHEGMKDKHKGMNKQDIVDTAAAEDNFSTLVAAVKAANLVDTLKGDGPFTVFAPINGAFERIPEESLNALLADKELLTNVLTYHVVPGKVTSEQVAKSDFLETAQGGSLRIHVNNGQVYVNGARVVTTDIHTKNGVIHAIETVIIPK